MLSLQPRQHPPDLCGLPLTGAAQGTDAVRCLSRNRLIMSRAAADLVMALADAHPSNSSIILFGNRTPTTDHAEHDAHIGERDFEQHNDDARRLVERTQPSGMAMPVAAPRRELAVGGAGAERVGVEEVHESAIGLRNL